MTAQEDAKQRDLREANPVEKVNIVFQLKRIWGRLGDKWLRMFVIELLDWVN